MDDNERFVLDRNLFVKNKNRRSGFSIRDTTNSIIRYRNYNNPSSSSRVDIEKRIEDVSIKEGDIESKVDEPLPERISHDNLLDDHYSRKYRRTSRISANKYKDRSYDISTLLNSIRRYRNEFFVNTGYNISKESAITRVKIMLAKSLDPSYNNWEGISKQKDNSLKEKTREYNRERSARRSVNDRNYFRYKP